MWQCLTCEEHNEDSRDSCHLCSSPRPATTKPPRRSPRPSSRVDPVRRPTKPRTPSRYGERAEPATSPPPPTARPTTSLPVTLISSINRPLAGILAALLLVVGIGGGLALAPSVLSERTLTKS